MEKKCFVIMPISGDTEKIEDYYNKVYENYLKKICEELNFTVSRADKKNTANIIQVDILNELIEASRRFFCPLAPNLQLSQLNQGS